MIEILIADDHTIVRKGLRELIEKIPGITVKDEASDGYEVLEKVQKDHFDIILLDLSMPCMNGLDVLKQIKVIDKNLPVLILSMHSETEYVLRALKAGASGYITKAGAPSELEEALKKVSGGGKFVSPTLSEQITFALGSENMKHTHEDLSDREFQVMCLLATGKALSDIAEELSLSVSTISTYRARIFEKLNFKNNIELARYVLENKLIE